jgi:hypothetical protein
MQARKLAIVTAVATAGLLLALPATAEAKTTTTKKAVKKAAAKPTAVAKPTATTVAIKAAAAAPAGGNIYVDGASRRGTCSDTRDRLAAAVPTAPVCTVARGAALAQAGDTVHLAAATYRETLAPAVSGAPAAPIRFAADEAGVVLDAAGTRTALKVAGQHDLAFSGFKVTGATGGQGVWVDNADRVAFASMSISDNAAPGIQVRNSRVVTVDASVVSANKGAGIQELGAVSGAVYSSLQVTNNGHDGQQFNGDGIQLDSTGTIVRGSTITGNGDDATYEHGIYIDDTATGYLVESNVLSGNSGSNIKAEGSGTVRYNRLGQATLGLYVDHSSGTGVELSYNVAVGSYKHAAIVAEGANARFWNNTLVNTNAGTTGQPTAVFVSGATSLDLRNNLLVATAAAGRAVSVPSAAAVAAFKADTNWMGTGSGTTVAVWDNTSVKLADWRTRSGQDKASVASAPPALNADGKVTSANLGKAAGTDLGLTRDVAGTAVPATPDMSAYQS